VLAEGAARAVDDDIVTGAGRGEVRGDVECQAAPGVVCGRHVVDIDAVAAGELQAITAIGVAGREVTNRDPVVAMDVQARATVGTADRDVVHGEARVPSGGFAVPLAWIG